jgi:hypothetical protein
MHSKQTNAENCKQIFPEKELLGHSPNSHIHVSVSDLYFPTIDLPILLRKIYEDGSWESVLRIRDPVPFWSLDRDWE